MKIKVNNREIEADKSRTLLENLRENGFKIPTLCWQEGLEP